MNCNFFGHVLVSIDFWLRDTRVVQQEAEVGVSVGAKALGGRVGKPCVVYSLILNFIELYVHFNCLLF